MVGFLLSIPVGYVEWAPFFRTDTDTVKDVVSNNMTYRQTAPNQPMEKFTES